MNNQDLKFSAIYTIDNTSKGFYGVYGQRAFGKKGTPPWQMLSARTRNEILNVPIHNLLTNETTVESRLNFKHVTEYPVSCLRILLSPMASLRIYTNLDQRCRRRCVN